MTKKTSSWTDDERKEIAEQRVKDNPPSGLIVSAMSMPDGSVVPIDGIVLKFRGPNTMAIGDDWTNCSREELINVIEVQRAKIAELESGINLPGWWCFGIRESGARCDTFNGEAKEKHLVCRRCEKPKPTPR